MQYQSSPVDSRQVAVHARLPGLLATNLRSPYQRPVSDCSNKLFARVEKHRLRLRRPVILDSGCGTGSATRALAAQHPHALIIGVDRSAHRLARGGVRDSIFVAGNYLLVRAELVDFWRLALQHEWRLEKHYLLFPNPWPKAKHLRRRWHGHPVFPIMLRLGGQLELRCNWRVYAEEFQAAVNYFQPESCRLHEYAASSALSLFECKYAASGHTLYRCQSDLAVYSHATVGW